MRRVLGIVVVLLLLLVGADRLAASRASSVVADQAGSTLSLSGAHASVHGFPFITQFLGNRMRHVTVDGDRLSRGGATFDGVTLDAYGVDLRRSGLSSVTLGDHADRATLHVDTLKADGGTLSDVHATGTGVGLGGNSITLADVTGDGSVANATIAGQIKQRTGLDVTVAKKDDALGISGSVLGQPLTATATPAVVTGGLRVRLGDIRLANTPVDASTVQRLTGMKDLSVTVPVDLASLPGLHLDGVSTSTAGLDLHLAGEQVRLAS